MASLEKITIKGFKSVRSLEGFELKRFNVLVGPNGAGKSNFVDFFRLLRAMAEQSLASFVLEHGKADTFLFNGPKITNEIFAHLTFGQNEYRFTLSPTVTGELVVVREEVLYRGGGSWATKTRGRSESGLKEWKNEQSNWGKYPGPGHYVYESVSSWTVYHFHDTSATAPMRRVQSVRDFRELQSNAGNIAAFLLHLKQSARQNYEQIRYHVQLVAPFFDDFLLEAESSGPAELVRLEWQQKGIPTPLQPHQFSDGTIRFICLVTALLQPRPPTTIVIDEPELGLHPFALGVLANLLRQTAEQTQIIISTQSPPLLDAFDAQDIIVVDREAGASTFRRLDSATLKEWLEEYSLGQIWQKNVFRGGPASE